MKRFREWMPQKEYLDNSTHEPPLVSEGDVWWASLGENMGSEINGKGPRFSRPVIILKKLARGFYLVAPITTKPHTGYWYVRTSLNQKDEYICLHQIRAIDYRRLHTKLGQISNKNFRRVQDGFRRLYL